MKRLVVLTGPTPTRQEERLLRFAAWMGVECYRFDSVGQLVEESGRSGVCLAADMETLAAAHRSPDCSVRLLQYVDQSATELVVFGCTEAPSHSDALAWLTRGKVRTVRSPEVGASHSGFHFPAASRAFTHQFAGITFDSKHGAPLPHFELEREDASTEALMLADGHAVFIVAKLPSWNVFLLTGPEIADVAEVLGPKKGIEQFYTGVIPALIIFGHTFGEYCWHGPRRTARLIIDDPLLAKRYGFLKYQELLDSTKRKSYGVSIAFIPWNYRRTSPNFAGKLRGRETSLSVCVHGCDHSNMEFDAMDRGVLREKAGLALERMQRHEHKTGLPFERVMVFPQGRFSTNAITALRETDYLAAINSGCFPTTGQPEPFTVGDLMKPAVTRLCNFPLFVRHYPRDLIDFAFDLFLGKPAIVVEHHQYFKDGCGQLETFIAELQAMEPALTWPTLASQLMRSCMMRRLSVDVIEVQFFTRRFQLTNPQDTKCRFVLQKEETDRSRVRAVQIDGVDVPFGFDQDSIGFDIELGPGETKNFEIIDQPTTAVGARKASMSYRLGVLVRRCLSEIRDNGLARHPGLLNAATGIARSLKLTGDGKI